MAAEGLESVATAKYFAFEIDGQPAERIKSVDPGAVEFGTAEGTLAKKAGPKVRYRPWKAERFYDQGNTHWHDLYKKFKDGTTGAGETASKINGSLTYFDKAQSVVLTVNFYDASVISYEPGHDVDAQAGGIALCETLEFEVSRVELA